MPQKNYANDNHSIVAFSLIEAKLLGEVGELVELFQWIGGEGLVQEVLSEETLDKAGQEIANVSIYLLRLCYICHLLLGDETMKLLESM